MNERNDLAGFLDAAWGHLTRGVADRHAPARHPTLATVSPDGWPEARTVVLRAAHRAEATLELHTDTDTAKIRALRASPRAALHVWVPRARLQIRVSADVEILTGAPTVARWANVPVSARVSYGTEPAPGTAITHARDYATPGSQDRFAVLCCHVRAMDLLELGSPHRRAHFMRDDQWQGTWVAP
jgi:pyridoxamine 5'-phosphate oxidase